LPGKVLFLKHDTAASTIDIYKEIFVTVNLEAIEIIDIAR